MEAPAPSGKRGTGAEKRPTVRLVPTLTHLSAQDLALEAATPTGWIIPDGWTYSPLPAFEPGAIEAVFLAVEDRDGELLDVVAWSPADPAKWWRRTGRATVLGADAIARSRDWVIPVTLLSTPAAWAHRAASGAFWCACVLDWDARVELVLWNAQAIRPASKALRQRLDATMRRQWEPPFEIESLHHA